MQQAQDELDVKSELHDATRTSSRSATSKSCRSLVDGRQGSLDAANATKQSAELRVSTLLPAEKASAQAALEQAQVDLDKTTIRAGVDGRVEQFALRVGDVVNPLMRPAGILIPEGAGQRSLQAGFGQIEAQVLKTGHGGGSHMQFRALDHYSAWSSQTFRITSRRVSSVAASN